MNIDWNSKEIIDIIKKAKNYRALGVQHYRFDSFLHRGDYKHFKNQLERDRIVREYCKKNNITLIEIPYTYLDKNKIDNIIDNVILKGEKPENLITIPDIIKDID